MFSNSGEDEDLFFQGNSSSLKNLFGVHTTNLPANTDLSYTAPKQPNIHRIQPKITDVLKQKTTQNSISFAKVVQVFKVDDDSFTVIGKYGLAIIGDTKPKEIILYKDKQNILAKATFKPNFQVKLKDDCISFYDNGNQKWNVRFEDTNNQVEFFEELKKGGVQVIKIEEKKQEKPIDMLITDSFSPSDSVSQSRADILSRMAKMGQSVIPPNYQKIGNNKDDTLSLSEKEGNIMENSIKIDENKESVRNDIPQTFPMSTNHFTQVSPYLTGYPSERFISPQIINAVIPTTEFNLFVSENRIQNSEIRMNLTAFNTKLDNVLQEINKIKEPTNTDRLENKFLKSKITDFERIITDLNKKLNEADKSKECMELEMALKNKDHQIENNKQEIIKLEDVIKRNEELIKDIRQNAEINEQNLNIIITDLQIKLKDVQKNIDENFSNGTELERLNENLLENNKNLNEKVKELERKINSSQNMDNKIKNFSDIIKDSMNSMFQNIVDQVGEGTRSEIQNILSTNIKRTTLNVIRNLKDILETSDSTGNNQ